MIESILKELKTIRDEFFDMISRSGNYYDGKHSESVDGIKTNSGGVDELGQLASDYMASIDDLATQVSDLTEQIVQLSKGKE